MPRSKRHHSNEDDSLRKARGRLDWAIQQGNIQAVRSVGRSYPQALEREDDLLGMLPLHQAANLKRLEIVEALIELCPQALQTKTRDGYLPIHYAARGTWHLFGAAAAPAAARSREVAQFLAERWEPALQDMDNKDGWLPLHVAAYGQAPLELVEYLATSFPAALRAEDTCGRLPAHLAAQNASLEVVRFLVERNPDALVHQATTRWLPSLAAALVPDHFPDYHEQDPIPITGGTPLHVAAQQALVEVVQLLAELCPQSLQERNVDGLVPLHGAVHHSRLEVVQCLVEHCPEALHAKDNNGWTPLHLAAKHATPEVVQWLADRHPEALLEKANNGTLPLHVAARRGALDVATCLVHAGQPAALRTRSDDDGSLPLHVAAQCAPVAVVRLLAGACPDALHVRDRSGGLPMHVAALRASPDVLYGLVRSYPTALYLLGCDPSDDSSR